jgi:hypothetical protein
MVTRINIFFKDFKLNGIRPPCMREGGGGLHYYRKSLANNNTLVHHINNIIDSIMGDG